jgi:tRNA(Ile2) C34 agmatinyltransferase TiaS
MEYEEAEMKLHEVSAKLLRIFEEQQENIEMLKLSRDAYGDMRIKAEKKSYELLKEVSKLRGDNERLSNEATEMSANLGKEKSENERLRKVSLTNGRCPDCGGDAEVGWNAEAVKHMRMCMSEMKWIDGSEIDVKAGGEGQ